MAIRKELVSIWPLDSVTSPKLFQHFRTASNPPAWCFQCPCRVFCSELTLYTHISPKINHEPLKGELEGDTHPPTHACPYKQSHSAHGYGGVCAGEPRALHSILGRQLLQEAANVCSTPRAGCTSSFSGRKEQRMDKLVAALTCQRQGSVWDQELARRESRVETLSSDVTDTSDLGSGQGQQ